MLTIEPDLSDILVRAGLPYRDLNSFSPFGWHSDSSADLSLDSRTGFLMLQELVEGKKTIVGKPASVLRKAIYPIFIDSLPDTFFEAVANQVRAHVESNKSHIEIWPASRIAEAYFEENSALDVNTGTLSTSCMRHDFCSDFMGFYTEIDKHNGEGFLQIAVLLRDHDNAILGRALIWNLKDGRTFMDRAYGTDSTQTLFQNYAKEQGWFKRQLDVYHTKDLWITPTGTVKRITVQVPIPRNSRMVYDVPYLDTFTYINAEEGVIHNDYRSRKDASYEDTEGYIYVTDSFGFRYDLEPCPESVLSVLKNATVAKTASEIARDDQLRRQAYQQTEPLSFEPDNISWTHV